ncbi:MAG: short-chain fatty acyl-CoA regulator family protein [Pseudomonadota bacterium]
MSVGTGTRIRERRLALGLRQAQLAREAGISPSYLNLIEHGRRPIGGALLHRIAERLEVDQANLSEAEDSDVVQALRAAGAAQGLSAELLEDADGFARRNPDWTRAIVAQADALAAQARSIEALSDRLSHDPALSEAMHELLSTVSVVRSTAAILAQTPEIDRNWLGRFHANLDADSRRLASGAEAVVSYFDRAAARGDGRLLPSEIVAQFLDAANHTFPALGREGPAAIPALVAEIADPDARRLASEILTADAADAARLPDALVGEADRPEALAEAAGGDLGLVLRRMGLGDPSRGLVICDAAGALVRRKAPSGFPLPVVGAGCPLWPLYTALSQPGRPLRVRIETPDGAQWLAYAIADPVTLPGFDTPPILRATMMLTRAASQGPAEPVGPGCRICPREGCAARREPSLVVQGAMAGERTGQGAPPGGNYG